MTPIRVDRVPMIKRKQEKELAPQSFLPLTIVARTLALSLSNGQFRGESALKLVCGFIITNMLYHAPMTDDTT